MTIVYVVAGARCPRGSDAMPPATTQGKATTMPSKKETRPLEPVGKWEATVSLSSKGSNRADMRRKVRTNGIRRIDASDIIADAMNQLRAGFEVRLLDAERKDAIRLYPCLDADYTQMFAAAQTMGEFRHGLKDIGFTMKRSGNFANREEATEARARRSSAIKARRQNVTPDTIIVCPKCGTEIRVGKTLV